MDTEHVEETGVIEDMAITEEVTIEEDSQPDIEEVTEALDEETFEPLAEETTEVIEVETVDNGDTVVTTAEPLVNDSEATTENVAPVIENPEPQHKESHLF